MADDKKYVSADSYMNYKDGGKVQKVMHEFKEGTLHSGSKTGPRVTDRKQAVAIAMSEARKAKGYADGGFVGKGKAAFDEEARLMKERGVRYEDRQKPSPPVSKQEGGPVAGPGGPTDDAVPANLSNGEYVIPADVVSYLGTAFFDKIVQQTQATMGAAAPNPFAEMATNEMGEMEPAGGLPPNGGIPPRGTPA